MNSQPYSLLSWNIQVGSNSQLFGNNWLQRRSALRTALQEANTDVLCIQEGKSDQLTFLDEMLPGFLRVGVGRDSGKSGGEHCAIYFREARFELIRHGTFWLSDIIQILINHERPTHLLGSGDKHISITHNLTFKQ
jgi:endonuclease/exonuclease/phosphatase family metal-dependent hydrolase